MVIRAGKSAGWLVAELIFALGLMVIAMIPLAYSINSERKLLRAHYHQVVAMEIIDGEMEILHAGQWRAFVEGEQPYRVTAIAATNLPPGKFLLTLHSNAMRLEWIPQSGKAGGKIAREIALFRNSATQATVSP